jgi:hypothetical protein
MANRDHDSIVKVDAGAAQAVRKGGQEYSITNSSAETKHIKLTTNRVKQPALPGASSQRWVAPFIQLD